MFTKVGVCHTSTPPGRYVFVYLYHHALCNLFRVDTYNVLRVTQITWDREMFSSYSNFKLDEVSQLQLQTTSDIADHLYVILA